MNLRFLKEPLNKFNANYSRKTRVVILISLFFALYFSYHALSGSNGLFKYLQLSKQLEAKKTRLQEIDKELAIKESNVKRISSGSLDLDLLDEQARKLLGYSEGNEIVIYDNKKSE